MRAFPKDAYQQQAGLIPLWSSSCNHTKHYHRTETFPPPDKMDEYENYEYDAEFDGETQYHLVMSADGTPLMVADTQEAVTEWLGGQNIGLATLH